MCYGYVNSICFKYFIGTTPKRREFNYPKILTKTGRHSTILKEFRSEYILEEAMNLPVPDDSFTESEVCL